jgi:SAM-dependent methyltransferase
LKKKAERDERRLYNDLAWIWPIISPPEDYVEESESFSKILKQEAKIEVKSLLHLGCGGGHNDYTFKKHFALTGVDMSESMLELARKLNPEVKYHHGDMRTVRLGEAFDAVAILDSIGYMSTAEDLRSAFVTAYEHLKPGGVFLTCVEVFRDRFEQNKTFVNTRSKGDIDIIMVENYYDPDPNDTSYELTLVYLIRRKGKLEMHTDNHVGGIFTLDTWHELLKEVEFEVKQMKFEHSSFTEGEHLPLLVCTKPL